MPQSPMKLLIKTWSVVGPDTSLYTGRPKALMASSRCHLPHLCLVTGLSCMGCVLSCILSPCHTGPPHVVPIPKRSAGSDSKKQNCVNPCQSGMGPLEKPIHVGICSWASSQFPGRRVSQLTSGEALPLALLLGCAHSCSLVIASTHTFRQAPTPMPPSCVFFMCNIPCSWEAS